MNNTPRSLLELYQLLWEQIKDKEKITNLSTETYFLFQAGKITFQEEYLFDKHIIENIPEYDLNTEDRKAFVQRMIKELENDK